MIGMFMILKLIPYTLKNIKTFSREDKTQSNLQN